MSNFEDEIEIKMEYSGLQSEMITLLKLEKYILGEKNRVQDRMVKLRVNPTKPEEGAQ